MMLMSHDSISVFTFNSTRVFYVRAHNCRCRNPCWACRKIREALGEKCVIVELFYRNYRIFRMAYVAWTSKIHHQFTNQSNYYPSLNFSFPFNDLWDTEENNCVILTEFNAWLIFMFDLIP